MINVRWRYTPRKRRIPPEPVRFRGDQCFVGNRRLRDCRLQKDRRRAVSGEQQHLPSGVEEVHDGGTNKARRRGVGSLADQVFQLSALSSSVESISQFGG